MHAITDHDFLAVTEPLRFFRGDKVVYLVSSTGPDYDQGADTTRISFYSRQISSRDFEERQLRDFETVKYRMNWNIWFVPYFRWLRKAKGMRQFRVPGQPNDFTSDFAYAGTEAFEQRQQPDVLVPRTQGIEVGRCDDSRLGLR